jgi:hypothetical protein
MPNEQRRPNSPSSGRSTNGGRSGSGSGRASAGGARPSRPAGASGAGRPSRPSGAARSGGGGKSSSGRYGAGEPRPGSARWRRCTWRLQTGTSRRSADGAATGRGGAPRRPDRDERFDRPERSSRAESASRPESSNRGVAPPRAGDDRACGLARCTARRAGSTARPTTGLFRARRARCSRAGPRQAVGSREAGRRSRSARAGPSSRRTSDDRCRSALILVKRARRWNVRRAPRRGSEQWIDEVPARGGQQGCPTSICC